MKRYFESLANAANGDALQGATMKVFLTGTDTLATLYETNDTSGPTRANPVTSDELGRVWFYAPDGTYDLVAYNGIYLNTVPDVELFDLDEFKARIAALEAGAGGANTASTVQFYDVASEPLLAGETDDNGRFARASAKVHNPADTVNFGRALFFSPKAGSGTINPGDPTNDPITGVAMSARRLPQVGDWLIDDFASYTPQGIAKQDGSFGANTQIYGTPGMTRWRKSQDKHYFLFAYTHGTGSVAAPNEQYYTIPNLTVHGIVFVEANWRYGFFESFACISLHAVDNVLIEYCEFLNYRGDCIYLGASDKGDGTENRHNRNVTIRYNLFDGYNMNNRNPISAQDWDGLDVYGNRSTKCCKPGGGGVTPFDAMLAASGLQMPASMIDFEPNIEVVNSIGKNANVWGNTVIDGGGDAVNVFPRSNATLATPQVGFSIRDNEFNSCRSGLAVFADENGVIPYNIRYFRNQVRKTKRPFQILRSFGLYIDDNQFEECDGYGDAGYEYTSGNFLPMAKSAIRRNLFRKIGTDGAGAFVLNACDGLDLIGNTFDDNSNAAWIMRGGGAIKGLRRLGNIYLPTARQQLAVGAVTAGGLTPVIDWPSCEEKDEFYNGLPNFGFVMRGGRTRVVPTLALKKGRQGDRMVGDNPQRGEAIEFYCVKGAVIDGGGTTTADALWGAIPAPLGIPNAAGFNIGGTQTAGLALAAGGSRFTSIATNGGFARGSASVPSSPSQAVTVQASSRQYANVFIGFTENTGAIGTLTQADMKFGMWLQNGTVRPMRGVDPQVVTPGAPDQSAAAINVFANQTVRVAATNADGSMRLYLTDPDTGGESLIYASGTGTGSANPLYAMVIIGAGDKGASVGLSAVGAG